MGKLDIWVQLLLNSAKPLLLICEVNLSLVFCPAVQGDKYYPTVPTRYFLSHRWTELPVHYHPPWGSHPSTSGAHATQERTGKQSAGTLCLQLSRETGLRWDRTNPIRDSKQTPLWQFFAILNQLEVFSHHRDSLQASNVHKAAPCHCLNSYRGCSSWKDTSHRTQTQRNPLLFKTLSNIKWEIQTLHKTQFLGSWRAAVGSSLAGTSDLKQVYKGVPTPLPAQKGRKSHAETWGRQDLNLGGKIHPCFWGKCLGKPPERESKRMWI